MMIFGYERLLVHRDRNIGADLRAQAAADAAVAFRQLCRIISCGGKLVGHGDALFRTSGDAQFASLAPGFVNFDLGHVSAPVYNH